MAKLLYYKYSRHGPTSHILHNLLDLGLWNSPSPNNLSKDNLYLTSPVCSITADLVLALVEQWSPRVR